MPFKRLAACVEKLKSPVTGDFLCCSMMRVNGAGSLAVARDAGQRSDPLTVPPPAALFPQLVDGPASLSAANRLLLFGKGALDGGIGTAGAVFAGAACDLRGRGCPLVPRELHDLMVYDEYRLLAAAAVPFPGGGGMKRMEDFFIQYIFGFAAGSDALLLLRERRLDGCVAAGCAAATGAACDLCGIRRIRKLVINDEHKLIELAERNPRRYLLAVPNQRDDQLIWIHYNTTFLVDFIMVDISLVNDEISQAVRVAALAYRILWDNKWESAPSLDLQPCYRRWASLTNGRRERIFTKNNGCRCGGSLP